MLKIWKVTSDKLSEPVFIEARTENEAKITFLNGEDELNFIGDQSLKIEKSEIENQKLP